MSTDQPRKQPVGHKSRHLTTAEHAEESRAVAKAERSAPDDAEGGTEGEPDVDAPDRPAWYRPLPDGCAEVDLVHVGTVTLRDPSMNDVYKKQAILRGKKNCPALEDGVYLRTYFLKGSHAFPSRDANPETWERFACSLRRADHHRLQMACAWVTEGEDGVAGN